MAPPPQSLRDDGDQAATPISASTSCRPTSVNDDYQEDEADDYNADEVGGAGDEDELDNNVDEEDFNADYDSDREQFDMYVLLFCVWWH